MASSQAPVKLVNESAVEFLTTEMVEAMIRTIKDDALRLNTDRDSSLGNPNDGAGGPKDYSEGDEAMEAVYYKLEMIGFRVGERLIEKISKDRLRFADNLDVVKFVCKEVWMFLFKKQVDNLKTNHRGVYVLQDNGFRWFTRMAHDQSSAESVKKVTPYLWFPCGILRGILSNLGIASVVVAETSSLPACTFQIKIAKTA
ncbi:BET3 family protein [Linnemannia elongata]|uniref:BET3 family protein n=1 Tax=Linnemannia elongata AG-77 TaxID=1314771 RepID=A0A197JVE7_9FUNG|nr:Trafficking protein particle complex subunit 33 [Linnemannia elongata]OAQ28411.1 BET3 family protein [Linnemannia elongata AG-77]KAG0059676.1 Trafficking protein particle complex subunit 33 [Linnemannia elongata]KAH7044729.1 BET3 family protein [Linnemannia elongata]KAK5821012.1 BET3 family protein [Linnemannia elongata]